MQALEGLRTAAAADEGLWAAMCSYIDEWRDEATILSVKAHADNGGANTNDHEKHNKRADGDAEKAYTHPDSPMYRVRYCSQFDTIAMRGGGLTGKR